MVCCCPEEVQLAACAASFHLMVVTPGFSAWSECNSAHAFTTVTFTQGFSLERFLLRELTFSLVWAYLLKNCWNYSFDSAKITMLSGGSIEGLLGLGCRGFQVLSLQWGVL